MYALQFVLQKELNVSDNTQSNPNFIYRHEQYSISNLSFQW